MTRVRLRRKARADIEEIAAFIARDNPRRALSFAEELEARCEGLAEQPRAGRRRPDLGRDLRAIPYRDYVILYVERHGAVEIVRVLHAARDLGRLV